MFPRWRLPQELDGELPRSGCSAARYEAEAAVREALVGNMSQAKQQAQAALAMSDGRDVEAVSAIALGLAGDAAQATRSASDLAKRFPKDTVVQFNYLPTIRAASALPGGSAKAIEALAPAAPYELGTPAQTLNFALYPVLPTWRGLFGSAPRQGRRSRVPENSRSSRGGAERANRRIGALGLGSCLRTLGRLRQSEDCLPGFLCPLERR
jgi:hypothetical protein